MDTDADLSLSVFICGSIFSLAKDRGADSDYRRALFDGDLEIVAHTHRQLPAGDDFISEPSQSLKVRTRRLRVVEEGRQHHQPVKAEMLAIPEILGECRQSRLRNARLCLLA